MTPSFKEALMFFAGGILLLIIGWISLGLVERKECKDWQRQTTMTEVYTVEQWQVEQCAYHGLDLTNVKVIGQF